MDIHRVSSLNPEDHVPKSIVSNGDISRPLGDHRLTVLESTENVGSFSVRLSPKIGITHKITRPRSMVEGVEINKWVTLNILALSSNPILLSSNYVSSKSEILILTGGREMRAYMQADTEYVTLAIHESLLVPEIALGVIDPRLLERNESYAISEHQKFLFAQMILELLRSEISELDFESRAAELAILMLSVISRDQAPLQKNNRRRCVKRATEIISDNDADNINLLELARNCHCSLRTLDYAFVDTLGMTPKYFLEMYRLNKLRRSLLQGNKMVGETAFIHGYRHLGNLAKSYTNLFGELPSTTRAKIPSF